MDYKGEMKRYERSAGLGGFAEASPKLIEPRNKTPLEELIAELGYRHARTKSSESVLYIEAQRPQWA